MTNQSYSLVGLFNPKAVAPQDFMSTKNHGGKNVSTPSSGREGDVYLDNTKVGHVKGFSASVKVEAIKDYSQDDVVPALLKAGNQSYKVDIDSMWLGSSKLDAVLAGTAVDIRLSGASGGDITFNDVILTDWKLDKKLTGAILESVSGEAKSVTV